MTANKQSSLFLRLWILAKEAVNAASQLATVSAPPVLRIALALPFFRSGFSRWDSFLVLSPGTVFLFEEQFKLHVFGGLYPFPFPLASAYLVSVAELAFPTLLVLGFGTRFAALCLLFMTGVIQLTYPDGWANFHLYWAAICLAIISMGAGSLSLDYSLHKIRARHKIKAAENGNARNEFGGGS